MKRAPSRGLLCSGGRLPHLLLESVGLGGHRRSVTGKLSKEEVTEILEHQLGILACPSVAVRSACLSACSWLPRRPCTGSLGHPPGAALVGQFQNLLLLGPGPGRCGPSPGPPPPHHLLSPPPARIPCPPPGPSCCSDPPVLCGQRPLPGCWGWPCDLGVVHSSSQCCVAAGEVTFGANVSISGPAHYPSVAPELRQRGAGVLWATVRDKWPSPPSPVSGPRPPKLPECAGAAVTEGHGLGGSRSRKCFPTALDTPGLSSRCGQGWIFLSALREREPQACFLGLSGPWSPSVSW